MEKDEARNREHPVRAAEVLRRLNDLGAINLDVLISKSRDIQGIVGGAAQFDAEDRICYPFFIRIGPRPGIDLVSVASELQQLGFQITRKA